jgi:hypothetical protein
MMKTLTLYATLFHFVTLYSHSMGFVKKKNKQIKAISRNLQVGPFLSASGPAAASAR